MQSTFCYSVRKTSPAKSVIKGKGSLSFYNRTVNSKHHLKANQAKKRFCKLKPFPPSHFTHRTMMTVSSYKNFLLAAAFLLYGLNCGQCVRVEFFQKPNYSEFLDDKVVSGEDELKCISLNHSGVKTESLKTDKCIIIYSVDNCKREAGSWEATGITSFRVDKNTSQLNPDVNKYPLKSMHVCSEKLGGGRKLNFDVYSQFYYAGQLVASFKGVCGCQNIPVENQLKRWAGFSVDNHGNSVELFEQDNCQGDSRFVMAGFNTGAKTLSLPWSMRSFRPAELENCHRLAASIYKFHFHNGTDTIENLTTRKVRLAADSILRNDRASEILRTLEVYSVMTEKVELRVAESLTKLESARVEAGYKLTVEAGVPQIVKTLASTKLGPNYQWRNTNITNNTENAKKVTITQEENIEVVQPIQIPPCRICKATAYVEMVRDFPVKYATFLKISAASDEDPLNAEELKVILPHGLNYTKDFDQHTVKAVTQDTMYVQFGLQAVIDVTCDRQLIDGCIPSTHEPEDYKRTYVVPFQRTGPISSDTQSFLKFLKQAFSLFLRHFN